MAVDTYTVVTRMILEDAGMAGRLDKITQALRETEGAAKGAKDAMRGIFPRSMVERASRFSDALRRTSDQVRYFGMAAANTRGTEHLANQLREANEQARALERTLAGMRNRGVVGGGRGSGPRVPGTPGAGGGGGHHGGIFEHGFINTIFDTQMIGQAAGAVLRPGMELGHQRYLAMQMGQNPTSVAALQTAAFRTATQVPSLSAAALMKIERELLPIMSYGQKAGEGNPAQEVIAHLGDAAKMDAILSNTLGEKAGDMGQRMSQYYNALRAGEIMNLGPHPKRLKAFTENVMKAVIASGGRLNAEQVRQFAATSGAAGIALDPDQALKYLPELMMEQGGSKVGTMVATFLRSGVGRTTKTSVKEWERLGIIDPKKVTSAGRGAMAGLHLEAGAWQNEQERFSDPMGWMLNTVAPKLADENGQIDYRKAAAGDQAEMTRLIRELNVLFTDRNAAKFAEELLLQSQAMEKFHKLTNQVNASYEDMIKNDPKAAWEAFKTSLTNFAAAATDGQIMGSIPGINLGSSILNHLAQTMQEHPVVTGATLATGGVGVAGVGGYALWGMMTAGPALKGSAVALTEAAAALDGAATRIAAGNGAGGLLGKGAAAGAGAAGLGVAGWLGIAAGAVATGATLWGSYKGYQLAQKHAPGQVPTLTEPLTGAPLAWGDPSNGYLTGGALRGRWTPGSGGPESHPGIADAIANVISEIKAGYAQLTGQVNLTGEVHVNAGELGTLVGHLIAQGIAHATGGAGASPATGARPDYSGGLIMPGL